MIGFYDYTVWLTYASLISAVAGIFACFTGTGHPYIGTMFLMFSGLCDAFDGKVARSKPNRTEREKKFGMQIDSLADLVAFGVLPAAIGGALYNNVLLTDVCPAGRGVLMHIPYPAIIAVSAVYVLAALVRLAYFNVLEEEVQASGEERGKCFTGLPVTSAALICPTFFLLRYFLPFDITIGYYIVQLLTALAFVSRIRVRKPSLKGVLVMVGIGMAEFTLLEIIMKCMQHVHR